MKVRVKLFAVAKELAGCDVLEVDVVEASTLAQVRRTVANEFPALSRVLPNALWAVGAEYAEDDTVINQHSEIAIIPPVSGG
jgi:molybdopterin converting factor subunit 1